MLVIASIPIFVLVATVILYCVWKFRMRPGQELMDGPPIHGNTRLEVFWTALPAALVLSLVSYSFVVLHENEKKMPGREIQVGVTGQQFFWDYEYPSSVTGGAPLKSYSLYVPKGESVYFDIHSKDVIHAFWIPAFRLQIDAVPGITTHYRATPIRFGHLPGRVQPAVRRRPLVHALGDPRGHPSQVPGVDQEPDGQTLDRGHRIGGKVMRTDQMIRRKVG